jgi:phosphatidylglycerophosphate synthase
VAARKPPTVAEVRAGGQPPGLKDRRNEEHWAGRLYMRDISPYFTWLFIRIGFSPNSLTYLMVGCGVLAGVAAGLWSGLVGAILAVVLVQAYLLLDCSDGELARFTGKTSILGVYLDRIGHYLSEVALLVGLGFRAQGALESGGWVELGLVAALGAALIKAETDNVVVARAKSGLPAEPSTGDRALRPRSTGLALARQAASLLRFHRIIGAVELSLLILVAAVIDFVHGDLAASRVLVVAVAIVAGLQTLLHLVSILASRRLT